MPELPEVEVTRASLADRLLGAQVLGARLGKPLRWPLGVPPAHLVGRRVGTLLRRGKYLWMPLPLPLPLAEEALAAPSGSPGDGAAGGLLLLPALVLLAAFFAVSAPNFTSGGNLTNVLQQVSITAVAAAAAPCDAVMVPVTANVSPGKQTTLPLIGTGVPSSTPWILSTSALEMPAVPNAGCFAAVAAPSGNGNAIALTS